MTVLSLNILQVGNEEGQLSSQPIALKAFESRENFQGTNRLEAVSNGSTVREASEVACPAPSRRGIAK